MMRLKLFKLHKQFFFICLQNDTYLLLLFNFASLHMLGSFLPFTSVSQKKIQNI